MSQPTHEQVTLMLQLYDLRREPRLRQARAWVIDHYVASSPEEFMSKYPPDSEENASIRMVVSYWEMVCGIANRGLMDEDLFFESGGEQWAVWEKVKPIVPTWRALFKNPTLFSQLEEGVRRLEAWREKRAPGTNEAMRQMFAQRFQSTAKAAKP